MPEDRAVPADLMGRSFWTGLQTSSLSFRFHRGGSPFKDQRAKQVNDESDVQKNQRGIHQNGNFLGTGFRETVGLRGSARLGYGLLDDRTAVMPGILP